MTQQPYYPPQQATYPPQQQPPPVVYGQPAYGAPAQNPYQQAQNPYGQPQAPQQPPAQPLVQGTLDDYYNQPTSGGGPSISWSSNNGTVQKPLGQTYVGVVSRDVTHGDVQQDTDPKTGAGKFYRDGRPRFVMKIPLKSILGGPHPSQVGPVPAEFPEGEGQWFIRGQARDELTRAQSAAGLSGDLTPKEGDVISVTLVERRPSRGGGMPANIVQVTYQPGPRWGQVNQVSQTPAQSAPGTEAPSPAAVPASQPAAPVQQQATAAYQQAQQPSYPPQGPPPEWGQPPAQQAPQLAQPVNPAPQAQQPLTPPPGLDAGQQELLARLQAQQNQG